MTPEAKTKRPRRKAKNEDRPEDEDDESNREDIDDEERSDRARIHPSRGRPIDDVSGVPMNTATTEYQPAITDLHSTGTRLAGSGRLAPRPAGPRNRPVERPDHEDRPPRQHRALLRLLAMADAYLQADSLHQAIEMYFELVSEHRRDARGPPGRGADPGRRRAARAGRRAPPGPGDLRAAGLTGGLDPWTPGMNRTGRGPP